MRPLQLWLRPFMVMGMVLYDNSCLLDLMSFGILVPSLDERRSRTLEYLRQQQAAKKASDWLVEGFEGSYTLTDLRRVHGVDYATGFFDERAGQQVKAGYELVNSDGSCNRWNPEGARRPLEDMVPIMLKDLAGTYQAGRIALEREFCYYLGGGTHHAHRDFGHGFCLINDTAIALRRLQAEGRIRKAWVIDLDAHKGDGTAAIFADDDTVTTFSIHMARGWPINGALPATHPCWLPSDIDVAVDSGEEQHYLPRLYDALQQLQQQSQADMAFVLAGVDPWEGDVLPSAGLLRLSRKQMLARDRLVYRFLSDAQLPSAWLIAGGYGPHSWQIHADFLSWQLGEG